jgi:hypothetical protein
MSHEKSHIMKTCLKKQKPIQEKERNSDKALSSNVGGILSKEKT